MWETEGTSGGGYWGQNVAGLGDVNGDGFDDVAVSGGYYDSAKVSVFLGSSGGPGVTAAWERVGFVASLVGGDFDGDGFADLAVSPSEHPPGLDDLVQVFRGSPSGLAPEASWQLPAPVTSWALFGNDTAVGDLNGDGLDDLLVGDDSTTYAYLGSPLGLPSTPSWTATGPVRAVGDVNGDGFDDVVMVYGGVTVYLGSSSGPRTGAAWSDPRSGVPGMADVDGDGVDELGLGMPSYTGTLTEEGASVLFARP